MPLRSHTACRIALFWAVAHLAASPVSAQKAAKESEAFFAGKKIPHLDIEIAAKPLSLLRLEPRTYVKATITVGDTVYPDVGIHLRGGLGSFRPLHDKPGLTLNMNKFGEDKLYHGMDKWHLCNSVQDPGFLSELVCGEMMRAAGVPASRIHHAVVTLNGRKLGMYYLKEGYDKHFLKRNFTTSDGNLYDGGFLTDIDQPIQILREKNDVKDRADLKALAAAAREPDLKKRFARLEKLLDMDVFISGFVVQAILGDWDGYVFNRNNYRVYHDPNRDKIVFIPSGMDQEFGNAERGPLIPPMKGLVARAVLETPEGRARYLKRMAEVNKTVMVAERWNKRLDELQERLQPEIAKLDARAGADFPNQVKRIREFFRIRPGSIERQLKAAK